MLNFIFATFAWFTYTKILNPAVDVDVSTWKIDFKDNSDKTLENEKINCFRRYPDLDGVIGSAGVPYNASKKILFRNNIFLKLGLYRYRNKFYLPIYKACQKLKNK